MAKQVSPLITIDQLKTFLHYDQATGLFTWRVNRPGGKGRIGVVAGTKNKNGYIQISVAMRLYMAHRLAWLYMTGEWPKGQIDHIDMNKTNNKFDNLRVASMAQNQANTRVRKSNKSGFKGVYLDKKTNKWISRIRIPGHRILLGYFDTASAAGAAYAEVAKSHFGEFSRTE
jgi:hypothetical protein